MIRIGDVLSFNQYFNGFEASFAQVGYDKKLYEIMIQKPEAKLRGCGQVSKINTTIPVQWDVTSGYHRVQIFGRGRPWQI